MNTSQLKILAGAFAVLNGCLIIVVYLLVTSGSRDNTLSDGGAAKAEPTTTLVASAEPEHPLHRTAANTPSPFHWSAVESTNYFEYVANLRRIGCPEQTIADIVAADLRALYAEAGPAARTVSGVSTGEKKADEVLKLLVPQATTRSQGDLASGQVQAKNGAGTQRSTLNSIAQSSGNINASSSTPAPSGQEAVEEAPQAPGSRREIDPVRARTFWIRDYLSTRYGQSVWNDASLYSRGDPDRLEEILAFNNITVPEPPSRSPRR